MLGNEVTLETKGTSASRRAGFRVGAASARAETNGGQIAAEERPTGTIDLSVAICVKHEENTNLREITSKNMRRCLRTKGKKRGRKEK